MDPIIPHSISNENEESDGGGSFSDRNVERRAAVTQAMAENREGLGMKVIAVMVQRYGVLPKELWDLNSISDMGAGRGLTYVPGLPKRTFDRIISNNRYSIVNLIISRDKDVRHKILLPNTLRQLKILAQEYSYHFDLPETLLELTFEPGSFYNEAIVPPRNLRKLVLGSGFNQQLDFPAGSDLLELQLGSAYNQPLILPQRLNRLAFDWSSRFNLPLSLPHSLRAILFGDAYNQRTVLPTSIEELKVGVAFSHDLLLPDSLWKIEWRCNRPIHIPEGVADVYFGSEFNQAVIFPPGLKKVTFEGHTYSHPLKFPTELEEVKWWPSRYDGLILPEGLKKLTWWSTTNVSNVKLPLGLKELNLYESASLALPDGLVKVKFNCPREGSHYNLPDSVQEVIWIVQSPEITFTHPTALQHFMLGVSYSNVEVDLSRITVQKLTIIDRRARIKKWPLGLKELAFSEHVDDMTHPLRVPKGCVIVGEKRPRNVILE